MKQALYMIAILMISLHLYSQQHENLKLSEKNKIIEEITKITDDMSFIKGSDKCILLCNLSFSGDQNTQNVPWCDTYLEALKSIDDLEESLIYYYITWEYKKISPMDLEHCDISGIFCYKMLTDKGCFYCGRNVIHAHFCKNNEDWELDKIKDFALLHLNDRD